MAREENNRRPRRGRKGCLVLLVAALALAFVAFLALGPLYVNLRAGEYNDRILAYALKTANQRLAGRVSADSMDGDPLKDVIISNIAVTDAAGETVIKVRTGSIGYSIFTDGKWDPRLSVGADNAWVNAARRNGVWNLSTINRKKPSLGLAPSYPRVTGDGKITKLDVYISPSPDQTVHIEVPLAGLSFETFANSVIYKLADLQGAVEPPRLAINSLFASGRIFNTGRGWDFRVEEGRVITAESLVEIKEGRYFTGTRELEALLSAIEIDPQTLAVIWPNHPIKVPLVGNGDVSGTLDELRFAASLGSSAGALEAKGVYARPEDKLEVKGNMNDFTIGEFLTVSFPASGVNGLFDITFLRARTENEEQSARQRKIDAHLDLQSFRYPKLKSFPFLADLEIVGDDYKGEAVSKSPGRDLSINARGNLQEPYPVDASGTFLNLDPQAFRETLPRAEFTGLVSFTGSGKNLDAMVGHGSLDLEASTYQEVSIRTANAPYRLNQGRLTVIDAEAVVEEVAVSASGWVELTDENVPFNFDLRALADNRENIAEWTQNRLRAERAEAKINISGRRDRWKAVGKAELLNVAIDEAQAVWAVLDLDLEGTGAKRIAGRLDLAIKELFAPKAEYQELRVPVMDLVAAAIIKPSDPRAPSLTFTIDTDSPDPEYGLSAAGALDMTKSQAATLDLQKLVFTVIGQKWTMPRPAIVKSDGPVLEFQAFELRNGPQLISVNGIIGRQNVNLALGLNRFDLRPYVRKLAPETDYEGIITASMIFKGPVASPDLDGSFTAENLHFKGNDLESAEGAITYAGDQLAFNLRGASKLSGGVRLWGFIPVNARFQPASFAVLKERNMDVQIDAGDLSLQIIELLVPWVSDLSGSLAMYAHIMGTPKNPDWNGWARMENIGFNINQWGLELKDLTGRATIEHNRLRVPGLSARSGQGVARLSGDALIRDYNIDTMNLNLQAENFKAMNTPEMRASMDADLDLTGTLGFPRIRGKVIFSDLLYRPPLILDYQGGAWESDDPTIAVKGEEEEPRGQSAFLDRGELDIKVVIPDNSRLRNSELNVRFGGELTLRKPPGGFFLIFGTVETNEGWLYFQGKPFRIERGVFQFPAIPVIDPSLDILASYRVPDYETYLKISGTLSEPSLEIYSEPSLDPADVLSVILFGRPVNELAAGERETLTQTGGQLVAGYAASQLASSLSSALNLDTVILQTGGSADTSGVGVGKYISDKLYVYYYQPFGENPEQFKVRYELFKNFSIVAAQDVDGQGGIDVYYTFTY